MKKLKVIILIMFIIINMCSCSDKNSLKMDASDYTIGFENTIDDNLNIISEDETTEISDDIEKHPRTYSINKSNIISVTDAIHIDEISFKFLKVYVSKKLPDHIGMDKILYFNEPVTDKGELKNNQVYVFIDISVENCSKQELIYYVSDGNFVEINENGNIIDSCLEVRYQSLFDADSQSVKDFNKIIIPPEEEYTITIGYIANESMVDSGALYYMINKDGYSADYDEIKAFQILDEVIERR